MFGTDLERFFEEQKGGIRVGQAAPVAGKVALGTDGYVCLQVGVEDFSIPIDNPLGYELRVESSFGRTFGTIDGVTASAAEKDSLVVSIPPGQTAGNEGVLHIKVMTAKEGRILYEGDTGIAYLNFLDFISYLHIELSHSLVLNQDFDPAIPNYSIKNAPTEFSIRAVAVADENATGPLSPLITIDGISDRGVLVRTITPPAGGKTVLMRVELPHGASVENYSFEVTRAGYSGASIVAVKAPDKTVYKVQSAPGTGFVQAGLEIHYFKGDGSPSTLLDPSVYTIEDDYDFTAPGPTTVTVTYPAPAEGFDDLHAPVPVYVVGLSALTVTGPGGYTQTVPHNTPGLHPLTAVPYGADTLSITATSAVAGIAGASLTIAGDAAVSGTAKTIPLAAGLNTITVTVKLDKGSGNDSDKSETWTLNITRASLESGGTFYVAGTDGTLEEGNDTSGTGAQAAPFATIKHALDLIYQSDLGKVLGTEYTIIVSGKITADTGGGTGMVEIGGGYPKIILKGYDTGTNVIDAGKNAGKSRRVLSISGGGNVTLEDNLTLTGGESFHGGGVYITGGGTFTMTGGVIEENETTSAFGGGVYVSGSGSAFTMTGGFIKKNTANFHGGGVYVTDGGTFTMDGGFIQNNTVSLFNGGGVYVEAGTFTMKGDAVIKNNTAYSGGGVFVSFDGTFTMKENAVIELNASTTATTDGGGGVHVAGGGTFTMSGTAAIQDKTAGAGGGVSVNGGAFIMKEDAVIEHNTSSSTIYSGGGVHVGGGTFTMSGDAVITDNTSYNTGGGVSVGGGTFTIKENVLIKDNTASNSGGGVTVTGGTFTMSGGDIEGNRTTGTYNTIGGGVYVYSGTFTMTGGDIEGNETAGGDGGGVYVYSISGVTFTKTGGTIAGSGAASPNTATNGQAVSLYNGKKRDTTAGPTDNLYAKYDGGWDYGSTGANWD
jgi:hypothetical protein